MKRRKKEDEIGERKRRGVCYGSVNARRREEEREEKRGKREKIKDDANFYKKEKEKGREDEKRRVSTCVKMTRSGEKEGRRRREE